MESQTFHTRDVGQDPPEGWSLGRALGWLNVGLGAAELIAPKLVAGLIGVEPETHRTATLRATGVRELASGVGILLRPRRAGPLWALVIGDLIDLGLLALATRDDRAGKRRLVAALVATAGVTALDVYAASTAAREQASHPMLAAITINRSPRDVEAYFQRHHPELGQVTFSRAPARSATEVRVECSGFGKRVLREKLQHDLREIKQTLETGEVLINHGEEMP